jgi:hypothetical protein
MVVKRIPAPEALSIARVMLDKVQLVEKPQPLLHKGKNTEAAVLLR